MQLRDYQRESIDAVMGAWAGGCQRPAIVLATGTGKTVIMAAIVSTSIRHAGRRPLILVHRQELVSQTVAKLRATDPGLSVGVIEAERHEADADVVVASVQSLVRRLGVGRRAVDLNRFNFVLVDEAHHASAKSYISVLDHFGALKEDSGTVALGVTATLGRSDGIPLGHVWSDVVFEYGAAAAIRDGWLVRPQAERVVLDDLDLGSVKVSRGDYSDGDLGSRMVRSGERIAESILEHGRDALGGIRRGIVFSPTVECAMQWAADFRRFGIRSEVVTGETPRAERQRIYAATDSHENDMIVSVMVLTEGFDLPSVEVAVVGRPTKSVPLYTQMVGRVLRPSPSTGKVGALVLDVGGKVRERLTTLVDLQLPASCECACACAWSYLCPSACDCPRSYSGRLKKPCLICAYLKATEPLGDHGACAHYDQVTEHRFGCEHICDGLGRPGLFPEDESDEVDAAELEAAAPLEVDDSEIVTESVELFDLENVRAARPRQRTPWLLSKSGRPFLPRTSSFDFTIFLKSEPDGTWTVGRRPRQGRAARLAVGLIFDEARQLALAEYPGMPPKLYGSSSPRQTELLARFNVDGSTMTKQEASDALSIAFASEWL